MKDSIRLFAAATVPPLLKRQLQALLQPFQHQAIRFLPEQNLHLTLYFIGNVPLLQLPDIQQQINLVARQHPPFILDLDCLELGPKPASPRLVWARFRPSTSFEQLSQQLTQALSPEPVQQQKPLPHITLARLRKDVPKPGNMPPVAPSQPIQLPVTAVGLWQSVLASPHPVYTMLESYPLS